MRLKLMATGICIAVLCSAAPIAASDTVIRNEDQMLSLDSFLFLESEDSAGAHISGDAAAAGFKAYDGGKLPNALSINRRMYTFRQTFFVDKSLTSASLCLFAGPADYPQNIYLNGVLLHQAGWQGDYYVATSYMSSKVLLPPQILKYGEAANEVAVEIFPRFQRNSLKGIFVSSFKIVDSHMFWRNFFNVHVVQGSFIFAIIIFLYGVFLYITRHFTEIKNLYFACFSLFYALGYIHMAFTHDVANDTLLTRIGRMAIFLSLLFLTLFNFEFVKGFNKNRLVKSLVWLIGLVPVLCLVFPQDKGGIEALFSIFTNASITPLLLLNLGALGYIIFRQRNPYHVVLLAGFCMIIAASLRDITYFNSNVVPFCWLVPIGYICLIVIIFFLISLEQSAIYFQSLEREKQILEKNKSLRFAVEKIQGHAGILARTSQGLEGTARDLIESARQMQDRSAKVTVDTGKINSGIVRISTAASGSSRSMISIATAIEAMTATIGEAARNATNAATVSGKAVETVGQALSRLKEFESKVKQIVSIIEIVTDIADQTNLLALNASIEAARAGEFGKSFQVVAGEVKQLARQTTGAINDISLMIDNLSESSALAIGDINNIGTIIQKINESIASIAASVEEQSATSKEIAHTVSDAAAGSAQVSDNLAQSATAAQSIETDVKDVRERSAALRAISESIKANADELNRLTKDLTELTVSMN
jgi:methyl-accepting chemotaxis protein